MEELIKSKYIIYVDDRSYKIEPIFKNKNSINIVFAFNDKYAKYFAVTLQSLIDNSKPKEFYDIVVFTSDLSDRNARRILRQVTNNFSVRFFNIKKYITACFDEIKFSVSKYWSEETYYRLFIPIIMNKYKRVMYFDTDIVFNGNISELFNTNFEKKELVAVSDSIKFELVIKSVKKRITSIIKDLGVDNPKLYFNAGVIMFNISDINIEDYTNRMQKAAKIKHLPGQDQDILNNIFYKRTKLVDWQWNLQYHIPIFCRKYIPDMDKNEYAEYAAAYENPVVIHFTSGLKPWDDPSQEFADIFWFYARKTVFYEEIIAAMCKNTVINLAKDIELYIRLHDDKKIVLWGASIFLEQFIRLYDIKSDNILGIVDKDPKKHGVMIGKYKCYTPEKINRLKPDEIIITILHYADKREKEIRKYVKENCSPNIKVNRIF